jgi:hypothetical protein
MLSSTRSSSISICVRPKCVFKEQAHRLLWGPRFEEIPKLSGRSSLAPHNEAAAVDRVLNLIIDNCDREVLFHPIVRQSTHNELERSCSPVRSSICGLVGECFMG